jgi:GNAT superfamily N-acetyltransferase
MQRRPLTTADATELHSLLRRWEIYWNAPLVTPLEEVLEEMERPHFNLQTDSIGFWDGDRLVAHGQIWHGASHVRHERAYAQGRVDPGYRGQGIGRALLGWQIERGTEILRSVGNDLPKYLRADEWDWIEDSHRLYRRFGLEPVRYFAEMLKPLTAMGTPRIPDKIQIVPWERDFDEQAREVINESFAEHWGSTPTDAESFGYRLEGVGTRLDLSFLAVAADRVVGLALNAHFPEDEGLLGRRDGWVEILGVLKEFRRSGVATALLESSFEKFRSAGLTHSAIGVDTANPTDAFNLYAKLGYEVVHRSITSELRVD